MSNEKDFYIDNYSEYRKTLREKYNLLEEIFNNITKQYDFIIADDTDSLEINIEDQQKLIDEISQRVDKKLMMLAAQINNPIFKDAAESIEAECNVLNTQIKEIIIKAHEQNERNMNAGNDKLAEYSLAIKAEIGKRKEIEAYVRPGEGEDNPSFNVKR